ncbi:MAG: YbaN family protein [Qingshengfaniella sp.]
MRIFWLLTGLTATLLGVIGILLPIMPTVPFLILATFCFGKSSPRLYRWLIEHPVYGPHIRDWQVYGSIRPGAKRLATISMAAAMGIALLIGLPTAVLIVQALALSGALIFIWTRPPGSR